MKRTFLMHGSEYKGQNVIGWLKSEKLDGGRAFWTPTLRGTIPDFSNDEGEATGLWTRDGKIIHAPNDWLDKLPQIPLDGELYLGRGMFQKLMSVIRCNVPDERWKDVQYKIFDMPTHIPAGIIEYKNTGKATSGHKLYTWDRSYPFQDTYAFLQRQAGIDLVEQTVIESHEQMWAHMYEVTEGGGEGLMVRDPKSLWTPERSKSLLKVKPSEECDVIVLGFYYGDGKYSGMMGSLHVQWGEKNFKVSGFTDAERKVAEYGSPYTYGYCQFGFHPGQQIRIKYRELSEDGIPKEARYSRP